MSLVCFVRDERGERAVETNAFPLTIGGEPGADIQLPGLSAGQTLAYLGLADGVPFIQPGQDLTPVVHNENLIERSSWLRDGDLLRIGTARITCEISPKQLRFRLDGAASTDDTVPPRVVPPSAGDDAVEPLPFNAASHSRSERRGRSRVAGATLTLLFAALVFAAWFIFTSAPVRVTVDPAPEKMQINGGLFTFKVGERYLLRPGRYQIVAEKTGYHRLTQDVEITGEPGQEVSVSLVKLPGLLSINTGAVAGAQVSIDGEPAGLTPLTDIALSPGAHEVVVRSDRYLEYRTEVAIEGRSIKQTLDVELTPAWAAVSFSSQPAGATLFVAGEELGATPVTTDLLAGNHKVEIRQAGYDGWSAEIVVVANEPQTVPDVVLAKSAGLLSLSSRPSGASVTVDGRFHGRTPIELSLRPDTPNEIALSKAGYASTSRTVSLASDERKTLTLKLKAKLGVINVVSRPADAELYVDGVPRGRANQQLTLTAVPHVIEVKKTGLKAFRTTVTPRSGFEQELRVDLESATKAEGESPTPTTVATGEAQALRRVEPGRFTMGASRREQGRRANENLRGVELTRAFQLGAKEVTNREFRRFLASHSSGVLKRLSLDQDDHPVVRVTWQQAAGYCNWLSNKESLPPAYVERAGKLVAAQPMTTGYRLPTEAEWAWAARFAGRANPSKYPWGGGYPPTSASGNYADESASQLVANIVARYDDGFAVTAPVGSFKPNALGIYDLGGNVAEWVHDYYTIYPTSTNEAVKDPLGPGHGKHHVIRGAGWRHAGISALRLTYRDYSDEGRFDVGFRIARYVK